MTRTREGIAQKDLPELWERIDALGVGEKWKKRFRLMAEGEPFVLGFAQNYPKLPFLTRFNLWGFFFGPLYYFYLRLWHKGWVLLGFTFLLGSLLMVGEFMMRTTFPVMVFSLPIGFICAHFAAPDYYHYKLYGEKMWSGLALFLDWKMIALFLITVIAIEWTAMDWISDRQFF